MLKVIQKTLKDLMNFMKKNSIYIYCILFVIAILYILRTRNEDFRFKKPILELEKDCQEYGYVCCRSSYRKEPILIKKCRGGSMEGNHIYYKCMSKDGDKIITSGLYNDYLIHAPGTIMRFSDNELYKLVSLDPTMKPVSCEI